MIVAYNIYELTDICGDLEFRNSFSTLELAVAYIVMVESNITTEDRSKLSKYYKNGEWDLNDTDDSDLSELEKLYMSVKNNTIYNYAIVPVQVHSELNAFTHKGISECFILVSDIGLVRTTPEIFGTIMDKNDSDEEYFELFQDGLNSKSIEGCSVFLPYSDIASLQSLENAFDDKDY